MEERDEGPVKVPCSKLGMWSVVLALLFGIGFWVLGPRLSRLFGSLTGLERWLFNSACLYVSVGMCVLGLVLAGVGLTTHGKNKRYCKLGFWLNAILLIPISFLAFALLFGRRSTHAIAPDERFSGVTEVHFEMLYLDKFGDAPDRDVEFTIDDPHEVRGLTQEVRLQSKKECKCGEHSRARFIKGDEVIQVSFCGHCFDIEKPDGSCEYNTMHHAFYRLVQEYEKRERLRRNQGTGEPPPASL
jgi:hypothetical protein